MSTTARCKHCGEILTQSYGRWYAIDAPLFYNGRRCSGGFPHEPILKEDSFDLIYKRLK